MATYKVLRPVEHDHVLYLPADAKDAPKTAISGADGKAVAANVSGAIELNDEQAKALLGTGAIPEFGGKPDTIEAAAKREKKSEKRK